MGADKYFSYKYNTPFRGGFAGLDKAITRDSVIFAEKEIFVECEGDYYIQFLTPRGVRATVVSPKSKPALSLHGEYEEKKIHLNKGDNLLCVELSSEIEDDIPVDLQYKLFHESFGVVGDDGKIQLPSRTNYNDKFALLANLTAYDEDSSSNLSSYSKEGYTPAVGDLFLSYGRFGFTKGDGVLDYSFPAFGIITRPFISSHPKYERETMWHFSILPDDEEESFSVNEFYEPPKNETIKCDFTHTSWERKLKNGKYIRYDYSTIAPSLLIESDLNYIKLSKLFNIGSPSRISLPIGDKLITKSVQDGVLYTKELDGELSRGYVMLTHGGSFPEVPMLLTLPFSPERILRSDDEIRVEFNSSIGYAMLGFPFGIELLRTEDLTDEWYSLVDKRIREYHSLSLARAINARDYFKETDGKIEVLEEFDFKYFQDSFGTKHKCFSPIPPAIILASEESKDICIDEQAVSLNIPTKYGPLYGVPDSICAMYSVPIPEYKIEIAFSKIDEDNVAELLHDDFSEYLEYHADVNKKLNPGAYSFIFQYSFIAKLFAYLKADDRDRLDIAIREGLRIATDIDHSYTGPGGRNCVTWYERHEPYTGLSFLSTYLHVTGIKNYKSCDRDIIENSKNTFIEIDWGNAMAIYGCYLGALLSNSWDIIEDNWQLFKRAFDYYLVSMDWACLSAAYAENGISWSDGTNIGGYIGFLNMAEMLGKQEELNLAKYAYAKLFAMRAAMLGATKNYLYKYFDAEPWLCSKFFHEETDGRCAFTSFPADIVKDGYRCESLYNLTTEGHYGEVFSSYAALLPEGTKNLLDAFERGDRNILGPAETVYHTTSNDVVGRQEVYTFLMLSVLTNRYKREELLEMIKTARENHRISEEILGTPLSCRKVPRAFTYVSLLSELCSKGEPRIVSWRNLKITSASYPRIAIEAYPGGFIEFSSDAPIKLTLNGKNLKINRISRRIYRAEIKESGELIVEK